MAKSLMFNSVKRVIFSPGEQRRFLLKAVKNLNLSWLLFANKIRVHRRTLNDWRREKYSLPLDVLKRICRSAKLKTPKNRKDIARYFRLIGTHNSKHKRKFKAVFGGVGSGCPRWS